MTDGKHSLKNSLPGYPKMHKGIKKNLTGILLLILGILFIFIGICRKEHQTVAHKSNMICLECIGIG